MLILGAIATPLQAQDRTSAESAPIRSATGPAIRPAIVIDAERNFYDLRSGVTRFEENVSITRGAMEVQADRGTIRQAEGQITEVELEGQPSTWQDRLEDGSVVTGEARMIHFDVIANIVTLTGNAIIRHEQGEFTGDELVYDLTAESLAGRSTGNERVRVVIEPDAMSDPRPTPPPANDAEAEVNPESNAEPDGGTAAAADGTAAAPGTGPAGSASSDVDSADAESTEPESTEPESTDPESTEPESTDPESAEPESTELESAEPESTEPESTEPDSTDPVDEDVAADDDGDDDPDTDGR